MQRAQMYDCSRERLSFPSELENLIDSPYSPAQASECAQPSLLIRNGCQRSLKTSSWEDVLSHGKFVKVYHCQEEKMER